MSWNQTTKSKVNLVKSEHHNQRVYVCAYIYIYIYVDIDISMCVQQSIYSPSGCLSYCTLNSTRFNVCGFPVNRPRQTMKSRRLLNCISQRGQMRWPHIMSYQLSFRGWRKSNNSSSYGKFNKVRYYFIDFNMNRRFLGHLSRKLAAGHVACTRCRGILVWLGTIYTLVMWDWARAKLGLNACGNAFGIFSSKA